MIDKELLGILVCPKSQQPLRLAGGSVVGRVNESIAAGTMRNVGGQTVESSVQGGLICDAERLFYPIIDDIPVLLVDEAIVLDSMGEE